MKITRGVVITEPGSTALEETGSWRTFRPEIRYEKCIRCMICWNFCPEPAIEKHPGENYPAANPKLIKMEVPVIKYKYCKGCGICVNECPTKAIDFVREEK
jgi:pyruvate ferredoxin oxidoreductase delta subunit/2-oxoisovalerate ferredoxin oxidoreductase delta subunit